MRSITETQEPKENAPELKRRVSRKPIRRPYRAGFRHCQCVDIACLEWRAASPWLIALHNFKGQRYDPSTQIALSPSSGCSHGPPFVLRNLPADHGRACDFLAAFGFGDVLQDCFPLVSFVQSKGTLMQPQSRKVVPFLCDPLPSLSNCVSAINLINGPGYPFCFAGNRACGAGRAGVAYAHISSQGSSRRMPSH
jgi:hypothetical protein